MKKSSMFFFGLAAIVLMLAGIASGQERQRAPEGDVIFQRSEVTQGPGPVASTFTFVNSEFSFDKLVKGAPYSAQAVTEVTQTLSDGNHIVNTNTAAVYRDGEGRTRREQTLKAIGNFSASGEAFQSISINDPVAGVAYVLEPHSHMARKIQGFRVETGAGERFKISAPGGEGEAFTFNTTTSGPVTAKRGLAETRATESSEQKRFRKEDLGTESIEGVSAVGTRTTITIAAGEIGNERPIEIVDERWFSPDLQTMVKTRHSDPRSGEAVYRLTNINRAEPDHSLFEVPAEYTLREEPGPMMRFRTEKPAKPDQDW